MPMVKAWQFGRENTSGGGSADVFARRYGVTSGWEVPEPQRLTHANYSGNLSVDEDRYGTVDIGWSQPSTGGYYQAMFSTQAVGGTWTSAFEESGDLAPGYTTTDIEPPGTNRADLGVTCSCPGASGWTAVPSPRISAGAATARGGADSEVGKIANLYASEIHTAVADDGRAVAAWTYYHCYYDDPTSRRVLGCSPDFATGERPGRHCKRVRRGLQVATDSPAVRATTARADRPRFRTGRSCKWSSAGSRFDAWHATRDCRE
jgi:hypothetical protein